MYIVSLMEAQEILQENTTETKHKMINKVFLFVADDIELIFNSHFCFVFVMKTNLL